MPTWLRLHVDILNIAIITSCMCPEVVKLLCYPEPGLKQICLVAQIGSKELEHSKDLNSKQRVYPNEVDVYVGFFTPNLLIRFVQPHFVIFFVLT